jgi:hypothetical protein
MDQIKDNDFKVDMKNKHNRIIGLLFNGVEEDNEQE